MQTETLHRKQYYVSDSNIAKLEEIAQRKNISAAEAVRSAIEAYDPDKPKEDEFTHEAIQFLADHLAAAIKDTRDSNEKIESLLEKLGEQE